MVGVPASNDNSSINNVVPPANRQSNGLDRIGIGGRFVQRLDYQEQELVALKARYAHLTAYCDGFEKWKEAVEKWIVNEFGEFNPSIGVNVRVPENVGEVNEDADMNGQAEDDGSGGGQDHGKGDHADADEIQQLVEDEDSGRRDLNDSEDIVMPSIIKITGSVAKTNNDVAISVSETVTIQKSPRRRTSTTENLVDTVLVESQERRRSSPRAVKKVDEEVDTDKTSQMPPKKRLKFDNIAASTPNATSLSKQHRLLPNLAKIQVLINRPNESISPIPSTSTASAPFVSSPAVHAKGVNKEEVITSGPSPKRRRSDSRDSSKTLITPKVDGEKDQARSLMDVDDDAPCAVCNDPDVEENNNFIFCDKCNLAVHQACYGVQTVPKGKWFCNPCEKGLDTAKLECLLCMKSGGALKPVMSPSMRHWAHIWCAWWVPEVKMGSKKTQEPVTGVKNIPKQRLNLKCYVCKVKKGAPIQCYWRKCTAAFHPTCAREAGLRMDIEDHGEDSVLKFEAYCNKHTNTKSPFKKPQPKKKKQ